MFANEGPERPLKYRPSVYKGLWRTAESVDQTKWPRSLEQNYNTRDDVKLMSPPLVRQDPLSTKGCTANEAHRAACGRHSLDKGKVET